MIKAVIFDVGGVLAPKCWDDQVITEITKKSLEEKGLNLPETFAEKFIRIMDETWKELLKTCEETSFGELIKKALRESNIAFNEEQIEYAVSKLEEGVFCDVHKRAKDILKELKDMGLKIGVISNAPGIFPIKALKRNDLDKYIDFAITSYQVGVIKPHPKIFNIVLNTLEVEPKEAVFVGDVPMIDIKGAKNVGMLTILIKECDPVMKKRGCDEITEESKPDYIIEELDEVIDIVRKINKKM